MESARQSHFVWSINIDFTGCLFRFGGCQDSAGKINPSFATSMKCGAGDVIRTRDIFLGKEVLYQLSYTRI